MSCGKEESRRVRRLEFPSQSGRVTRKKKEVKRKGETTRNAIHEEIVTQKGGRKGIGEIVVDKKC